MTTGQNAPKEGYTLTTASAGRIALSIAREPFAWPGGYERFAVTDDDGVLCWQCCTSEISIIRQSDPGDGWHVVGASSLAEDDGDVTCDHCGRTVQEAWDASA
jgi:hypothetical protein